MHAEALPPISPRSHMQSSFNQTPTQQRYGDELNLHALLHAAPLLNTSPPGPKISAPSFSVAGEFAGAEGEGSHLQ
jgi:hypothetical protein